MGFLQWLALHQEQPESSQLDIFGGSQTLTPHERVDVRSSTKDLNKALTNKGGDLDCLRDTAIAITEETFGCKPKELYKATGGKEGDRTSLPKEAQKALISTTTVVTHVINAHEVQGTTQGAVNQELTDKSREVASLQRKWFPW